MDKEILLRHGIDYDKGLERFLGEEELYQEVLAAFLDLDCLDKAVSAYDSGDFKALFEVAHEVKGSSGNCDMTTLFATSSELCDLLRFGNYDESKITPLYRNFSEAYKSAYDGIKAAINQ